MVRASLLDSKKHKNIWCCAAETYAEVYICKIHNALDNASPHFAWYGKHTRIHELRAFVYDIYLIKPKPKKLYTITQ